MRKRKSMMDITKEELYKIRHIPRWITIYPLIYPHEVDDIRKRLADSGIKYRTEKIYRDNKLLGYRVKVME